MSFAIRLVLADCRLFLIQSKRQILEPKAAGSWDPQFSLVSFNFSQLGELPGGGIYSPISDILI